MPNAVTSVRFSFLLFSRLSFPSAVGTETEDSAEMLLRDLLLQDVLAKLDLGSATDNNNAAPKELATTKEELGGAQCGPDVPAGEGSGEASRCVNCHLG